MKFKISFSVACIILLYLFFAQISNTTEKEITIEWLGHIQYCKPYSGIDPSFYDGNPPPDMYWKNNIEIGLRSDGVLVWRYVKPDTTNQ